MEKIVRVRINQDGQFNRGGLRRIHGRRVLGTLLPDNPKHGPALVAVEKAKPSVSRSDVDSDIFQRPLTFHP